MFFLELTFLSLDRDKDIKKEGKGVSGYDVEDEKNFYKIDGTS